MKKIGKILIAFFCVFSLVTVSSLTIIKKVHADSGWDSDYDFDFGGGSDWGSSDWDSGYSSSSGGGGSLSFGEFIFFMMIVGFIVLVAIIASARNGKRISNGGSSSTNSYHPNTQLPNLPKQLTDDEIHAVDPNLDIEEFKKLAYRTYWDIQQAWMEFDYDSIRKYTTDEIYNMYSMQLDTLSVKGQKNIMKDFFLVNSYISNISMVNGVEEIDVIMTVKFLDYVVDSNNNVVRGSSNQRIEVTYRLTLVKKGEISEDTNFCPNCGAKLEDKASSTCPYCKSVIVADNYTWVMSKKESLNQRRG